MNAYTHELKTDHEPFAAVLSGEKTHEIRYDDRSFKVGDTIILKETRYSRSEMFGEGRPLEYTGRTIERVVTHIQRGYGLPASMVVMSLAASTASDKQEAVAVVNKLVDGGAELQKDCPDGTPLYVSSAREEYLRGFNNGWERGRQSAANVVSEMDDKLYCWQYEKAINTLGPETLDKSAESDKQEAVRNALEQSTRMLDSLRYDREPVWKLERQIERNKAALAAPLANPSEKGAAVKPLTDAQIESGWRQTFSTDNPFCPCNLKSFTKAVRWAERAKEPK